MLKEILHNGKKGFPLLLVLSLLFLWSCEKGKGPTKFDAKEVNQAPETSITSKILKKLGLETDSTGAVTNLGDFSFSVEYTGTDLDGSVDSFAVRIDGGAYSTWTIKKSFSGTVTFNSSTEEHIVEVKSKDNEGTEDPTPAVAKLSLAELLANKLPTTSIVSGPSNGSTTGNAVKFDVTGADENGDVVSFIYSLDSGAETTVAADDDDKAVIEFNSALGNLLALGTHAISVRSVDNYGAEDATPATVSFFVSSGFKPILTQADGPPPGGGWFTGANIPFAWTAFTSYYFGTVDHYEYSIDDPVTFTSTNSTSVPIEPQDAGSHTFRLKAVDTGGNISDVLEVTFDVALFAPTEGILFIDDVNFCCDDFPSYNTQQEQVQQALDGFFKNFTKVSVWDVTNASGGSSRFEGAINSTLLPGPADLAKFSSVVIMTDGGYAVDNISPLLAAYFQAGGNLMITGYSTTDFHQVLKDVLGTPSIFNGFGSNFASLEGYQPADAGGNISDAYAFIIGDDLIPVIAGVTSRSWEITTNTSPRSFRVLLANTFDGNQNRNRIATEVLGEKGNYGLWMGIALWYLDQTSTGIVKLGDFVLGTRFGEM